MRVGVLARGEIEQLAWAQRLGFRSVGWMRFELSPAGPAHAAWQPYVDQLASAATNAAIEGDDFSANVRTQPSRLKNYTPRPPSPGSHPGQ